MRFNFCDRELNTGGGRRERHRLIFGERRLRAVKLLGHETIAAQLREHMTDDEFRAIELEENDNRKALTEGERARTFESAKKLVERAKQAGEVSPQSAGKPQSGRPSKYGKSKPEIAADLAVSEDTLERAERHVETVEHWPFMRDWRQSQVLAVREAFELVPTEDAQQKIVAILACARMMDAALAVELIGKLAKKPPKERDEIYRLSQSEDDTERASEIVVAVRGGWRVQLAPAAPRGRDGPAFRWRRSKPHGTCGSSPSEVMLQFTTKENYAHHHRRRRGATRRV